MSANSFVKLTNKYPGEVSAIKRLENLLESGRREFSSNYLYDNIDPSSMIVLQGLINELITSGALIQIVRVNSPFAPGNVGVGGPFTSVSEIPETLTDDYSGTEFDVYPEMIEHIYKVSR